MRLGYNTNGLAHHRLLDAIALLGDEGYQSIAITLDAGTLDPYQDPPSLDRQVRLARSALDRHGMTRVIETGARYLLNPRVKHDPTLLDPDPARRAVRVDFLCRAIDLARSIQAESVSLWSGAARTPIEEYPGMDRLVETLRPVLAHAEQAGVTLAFEPEPGMFIDSLERFGRLDQRVGHPLFQLTMDVGHVHCMVEGDIASLISQWRRRLVNIHIEDMVEGIHEHLMFGQGTIDFPPIFRALHQIGFEHTVSVELSRHSHMAVEAVCAAAAFLKPLIESSASRRVEPSQS
jgi:sugar phosphate isomerase/epimerase